MPVYYGFTTWSYGGEMNHAGRATVMPQISMEKAVIVLAPGESWLI